MYTIVVAAPPMKMPRGIVRSGSTISWPMSDVISKPENAKHIADQRPIVSSRSPRGTIVRAVNGVADPNFTSATNPHATSTPTGIQTPRLPAFCSHLPRLRPMTLIHAAAQMPASTNATEYQRLPPSASQWPIAAKFAAPNSSSDGK